MDRSSRAGRRTIVGLDIEPGQLAAAEARKGTNGTVERTAVGQLPSGLVRDGEVVDTAALAEQLRGFFKEHRLPKRVRLGVANQRIIVRTLELPPLEDRKHIAAAVAFEAQEQIPMPLDQAVTDFEVIGAVNTPAGPRLQVLLVAARRDMIMRLVEAVRQAGLRPEGVDLSAFALVRALDGRAPEPGTAIYANVGGLTNLAVATGSRCLLARTVPIGLEPSAAAVAERCGLTLDHARMWLEHVGLQRAEMELKGDRAIVSTARAVLLDAVARVAEAIRTTLDFYGGQPLARPVERAVLAGPALGTPGFVEALARLLEIPVERGRVPAARLGANVGSGAERLAVATGLALDDGRPDR